MGDLVEGIGDEVLLFVGFLVLSLVFIVLVTFWKGQGLPAQAAPRPQEPVPAPPPTQPQQEPQARGSSTLHEGLRRRPHLTVAPDEPTREETVSDSTHQEPGGNNGGRGHTENADAGPINIRLVQAGGPERSQEVSVSRDTTMDHLRRHYFQAEVAESRPVRFIYQGRVITDDSTTLHDLSIGDGGAMHVHVGRPRPTGAPVEAQPEILDLSHFFVPLFGVILGVVWMCMLAYPYVFTLLTKLFLFLLSIAYVILAYLSTYGH